MGIKSEESGHWAATLGRVNRILRERGVSVSVMAREMRVKPETLYNYLRRGRVPPSAAQYGILAWAMGFRPFAEIPRRAKRALGPESRERAVQNLDTIKARAEGGARPPLSPPRRRDPNQRPLDDIIEDHTNDLK